jgi:polysaccharide pyruvyl transferase WcaK-like protein
MISGLSTATPTVVVGWSHKYKEVLDDFGLADFGMDSTVLSHPEKVADVVVDALSRKNEISEQISRSLPSVRERSMKNFVLIASAVRA